MGPSTFGVLLSKNPVLQKKATTKGLAVAMTDGDFGGLDQIAKAKPGADRFAAYRELATNNPIGFQQFKDSVLTNIKKEADNHLDSLRQYKNAIAKD